MTRFFLGIHNTAYIHKHTHKHMQAHTDTHIHRHVYSPYIGSPMTDQITNTTKVQLPEAKSFIGVTSGSMDKGLRTGAEVTQTQQNR